MEVTRVTIIGVNPITTAIALSFKAQKEAPEIIGHDAKSVLADLARARGALDKVARKSGQACADADLVIVGVPLTAVRETLAAIAPHLKPGCLVTDTAHLKVPVMRWAAELLPQNVSFIGGHLLLDPAVVGLGAPEDLREEAGAGLLKGALYCYTLPTGISNAAINAFLGLANMIGAHPFSIDTTEHDGLQAGIEDLPDLLAVALLRATVDTPGWQEMRKFAGHRFATTTEAAADAHERHATVFLNRDNMVHRLNLLLEELARLRDLLTQDDAEPLQEAFVAAADARERWLHERGRRQWGPETAMGVDQVPTTGQQFRQSFLGETLDRVLFHRKKGAGNSDKK